MLIYVRSHLYFHSFNWLYERGTAFTCIFKIRILEKKGKVLQGNTTYPKSLFWLEILSDAGLKVELD